MKIMLSAGELSGDFHAAQVVKSFVKLGKNVEFIGYGGPYMRAAGVKIVSDFSADKNGAVMGFFGVIQQIPQAKRTLRLLRATLLDHRPDALVIIDYPDFNLRLAQIASELKIPVFSFIIPKMWAWRASRIAIFKQHIKHAFTILPFEPEWLSQQGFNRSSFVGNPTVSSAQNTPQISQKHLRKTLGLTQNGPILLAMPGSRRSEIQYHAPVIGEVHLKLKLQHPALETIIPVAASIAEHPALTALEQQGIRLFRDVAATSLMPAADIGLIKSGTSTLEAVAARLPSIMFFKTGEITAWIVRHFVRNRDFSLPNIIKPGTIQELLQERATPEALSGALNQLLDPTQRQHEIVRYEEMLSMMNRGIDTAHTPYELVARGLIEHLS